MDFLPSVGEHDNTTVQGLWIGPRLSALEQLSIQSFLANGHQFHLYVYEGVENVPHGTVVKDANDVLPSIRTFKYREHDSYAGFANQFRYKLLHTVGGWWVDLDLVCLKPFDFATDYVFSSEDGLTAGGPGIQVNVGAIKCPAGSSLMQHVWDQCSKKDPAELRWGEIGPILFADSVRRFGMESFVVPPSGFCPIAWRQWQDILDPDVPCRFTGETYAVHLWNEMWRREGFDKDDAYAASCLFERLKARYLPRHASTPAVQSLPEMRARRPAVETLAAPTVSAVVLSKNGSTRIARCLESIQHSGFADEIVVCVDADTTDDTVQVARAFTPHVHLVQTSGYIEPSLATMTAFCSGDFVLRIDDDERLGGNWDKASFQLLALSNHLTEVWVPRRWIVPPGDTFLASPPWFPDAHPRLYINDPSCIVWPEHPHEQLRVPGCAMHMVDRWVEHYNLVDHPKGERRRRDAKYRALGGQCDSAYYLYEDHESTLLPRSTTALELAAFAQSYQLDSVLDFSATGNAGNYLQAGWSHAESWGTWTVGDAARIRLPLATPADAGAIISVEVAPYLNASHPTLQADVVYADTVVTQWTFDSAGPVTLTMHIDADLFAGDARPCLTFRIADARSPCESGESTDPRHLGLGFRSLRLSLDGVAPTKRVNAAAAVTREVPQRKRKESFAKKAMRLGRTALLGAWPSSRIWRKMDCKRPGRQ
jgi:hypothetical protein